MPYLLDTNTCIAAMRHVPLVVQRLAAVSPADCAITTITGYELYTGIEKCADAAKELAKVNLLLATIRQLVFDAQAAREAARIRALLESQGRMIGPYDILLAGHALSAGLTLVTANIGEFSRVPALLRAARPMHRVVTALLSRPHTLDGSGEPSHRLVALAAQ